MARVERVFSHLALAVTDLERLASFYVEALGFRRGERYSAAGRRLAGLMDCEPDGFEGIFLGLNEFRLELLQYRTQPRPGPRPRNASEPGYAHTSFVVSDFEGTIEAIERGGGRVLHRMSNSYIGPGSTALAFCADPDGNRVELVWHPSKGESDAHIGFLGMTGIGWPAHAQLSADL
ncbi:VOC family protein [Mycobacterium sp. 236(2023)]|uniref:VOC family protein n=1 Tax=Mycobacterium sp. 236(2023) TaxID=3038163 RepID=UPI0024150E53|nr:VOC family protein [Mycobacterium sp. 236(2023)]MDG4668046.1 VOC family protein [Mycobacterium sp. 236(2023)]